MVSCIPDPLEDSLPATSHAIRGDQRGVMLRISKTCSVDSTQRDPDLSTLKQASKHFRVKSQPLRESEQPMRLCSISEIHTCSGEY